MSRAATVTRKDAPGIDEVAAKLRGLCDEVRRAAAEAEPGGGDASVANMRAYLALRRQDNHALQASLARLGLPAKIALAHLSEFPDYYTRLERMEQAAKRELR